MNPEISHETPSSPLPIASTPNTFRSDRLSQYQLRFVNRLKSQAKSPNTLAAYANDISLFSLFLLEKQFGPGNFGVNLRQEWEHFLKVHGRHSAASVRRALMSVRSFLHFLVAEKIIHASPLLETKSPEQPKQPLMQCHPQQFQQLVSHLEKQTNVYLENPESGEKCVRDLALVLALGECGLKASETTDLKWQNVHLNDLAHSGSLTVAGDTPRIIPFGPSGHLAFSTLKVTRLKLGLASTLEDPVLYGYVNVSRQVRADKLHRHGIKFVVYEITESILGIPFNSESLRNLAIGRWLAQGLTLQQVADLAGYSSLNSLDRFSINQDKGRAPKRKHKIETPRESEQTNL
jgi:integrase/recombinase XerD